METTDDRLHLGFTWAVRHPDRIGFDNLAHILCSLSLHEHVIYMIDTQERDDICTIFTHKRFPIHGIEASEYLRNLILKHEVMDALDTLDKDFLMGAEVRVYEED